MKIAIFASGNGSNFEVLAQNFQRKSFKENELALLFCDHPDAYVLKRAKKYHVPTETFTIKECQNKVAYEQKILNILKKYQIDLIALAGYMKVIGSTILDVYEGRIINLHPSYLPEFQGLHAIERAYEDHLRNGRTQTGVTLHYIDAGLDTGPIIKQQHVPIYPHDSLAQLENRIHTVEHKLYPQVLKEIFQKMEEKE